MNKSEILLVLCTDIVPAVLLPSRLWEVYCGHEDLNGHDQGLFMSEYGQCGVPLSIPAASMVRGSGAGSAVTSVMVSEMGED